MLGFLYERNANPMWRIFFNVKISCTAENFEQFTIERICKRMEASTEGRSSLIRFLWNTFRAPLLPCGFRYKGHLAGHLELFCSREGFSNRAWQEQYGCDSASDRQSLQLQDQDPWPIDSRTDVETLVGLQAILYKQFTEKVRQSSRT